MDEESGDDGTGKKLYCLWQSSMS